MPSPVALHLHRTMGDARGLHFLFRHTTSIVKQQVSRILIQILLARHEDSNQVLLLAVLLVYFLQGFFEFFVILLGLGKPDIDHLLFLVNIDFHDSNHSLNQVFPFAKWFIQGN